MDITQFTGLLLVRLLPHLVLTQRAGVGRVDADDAAATLDLGEDELLLTLLFVGVVGDLFGDGPRDDDDGLAIADDDIAG